MSTSKRTFVIGICVAVCIAIPIGTFGVLILSDRPRLFLDAIIHYPVEVTHKKAVLAARRGDYDEAIALFSEVVERTRGRDYDVLADYFSCLVWAGRYSRVIEIYEQLPAEQKSRQPFILAAAKATLALNDHRRTYELLTLWLGAQQQSLVAPFRAAISATDIVRAVHLLHQASRASYDEAPREVKKTLLAALQSQAVGRARLGESSAALQILEGILASSEVLSPSIIGDYLDVLCQMNRLSDVSACPDGGSRRSDFARDALADASHQSLAGPQRNQAAPTSQTDAHLSALYDGVVVLSWAERHIEAIERFQSLPPAKKLPTYLLEAAAKSFRETGRPDSAIALYREILRREPNQQAFLDATINLLLEAQRFSDARDLVNAIEPHTRLPTTAFASRRAYIAHQEAVALARRGEHEKAQQTLLDLSEDPIYGIQATQDLAVVQAWATLDQAATATFESLPDPMAAATYVKLNVARSYRATGRIDEALRLYAAVLRKEPANQGALLSLKMLLLENSGDAIERGLWRLDQTLAHKEVYPNWISQYRFANPNHQQAVELARSGKHVGAWKQIHTELKNPASEPGQVADYVVLLYLAERYGDVAHLSWVIDPEGTDIVSPVLLELASVANRASGEPSQATAYANRWSREHPDDPEAASELARGLTALAGGQESPSDNDTPFGLVSALIGHAQPQELSQRIKQALTQSSAVEFMARRRLARDVLLGLHQGFVALGRHDDAERALRWLLATDPKDIEVLLLLAAMQELQERTVDALRSYNQVLALAADHAQARRGRWRVLTRLSAVGLVREEARAKGVDSMSDEASTTLALREALQKLAWEDFDEAKQMLRALDRSLDHPQDRGATVILYRARHQDEKAILAYESLQQTGVPLSDATLLAAAGAYLALDQPEQALAIYQTLEARLEQAGENRYPENHFIRISRVNCLVRMMRYEEAGRELDRMDGDTPPFIEENGRPRPNGDKTRIAAEKGWLLLAQDQLAAAEKHFAEMIQQAPEDGEARLGLAHTYKMRGWPRRAEDALRAALVIAPDDITTSVDYARLLHENHDEEAAEKIAATLTAKKPTNKRVQELNRSLELGRARAWMTRLNTDFGAENNLQAVTSLTQPLRPRWSLKGLGAWHEESEHENRRARRLRGGVGFDYGSRDLDLSAAFICDSATPAAVQAEAALALGDHVSVGTEVETSTWQLPPQALRNDVTAKRYVLSGRYAHNELFDAEAKAVVLALDDKNVITSGQLFLSQRVFANGRFLATVHADASVDRARSDAVRYYSPKRYWSVMARPQVQHLLLERKRYVLLHSIEAAVGVQDEADFGRGMQSMANYSQTHRIDDTVELSINIGFSSRPYDGQQDLTGHVGIESRILF